MTPLSYLDHSPFPSCPPTQAPLCSILNEQFPSFAAVQKRTITSSWTSSVSLGAISCDSLDLQLEHIYLKNAAVTSPPP